MYYLETRELYHHGIKGQKWGIRRYQNEDGTLTKAGKKHLQEVSTLVGRTRSVEIDMKRASEKGYNMVMPKDQLVQYKKDVHRLNELIDKFEKENVTFDTAYRTDYKTGEEFVATVFSNGQHINDMPMSSIYEYRLNLINK